MAQSVSNASCVGFIPARNGWSATRVAIDSISGRLVFVGASSSLFMDFLVTFRLNEFVFLFADDEHRTRRGPDHAFGRAANRKMFPTRITVGREHDEIDVEFLGRFDDLKCGQAGADTGSDTSNPGIANRVY